MNKADIDAWISARKALDREGAGARVEPDRPAHDLRVRIHGAARRHRAVRGASSRVTGDGSAAIRSLYYGGCLFQAPAGRAD